MERSSFRPHHRTLCMAGLLASLWTTTAMAVNKEHLNSAPLSDFHTVYESDHNDILMLESVPKGESAEDWTQMVTTQVFIGTTHEHFYEMYRNGSRKRFAEACDFHSERNIDDTVQNGYQTYLWQQSCFYADSKKKRPENTWFRLFKGKDATYVLQWAWHTKPTEKQLARMVDYMTKSELCYLGDSKHPCPKRTDSK